MEINYFYIFIKNPHGSDYLAKRSQFRDFSIKELSQAIIIIKENEEHYFITRGFAYPRGM